MKILITGAGGMLGSDLVSVLASAHDVVGVGRSPAPHLKIRFQVTNLREGKKTSTLIEQERPQLILHAAAMTDVDGCESRRQEALLDNFEATRHVTEAANQVGALLIFFSTDFVFDGTKKDPYVEGDTLNPINTYGETKFLAERYLQLRGQKFLILRTAWLFGRHGNNFPQKVLKQAEAGEKIRVVTDQIGNPTYTRDLAEATRELIEILSRQGNSQLKEIYHLTNEGIVSRHEWAQSILRRCNYPLSLLVPVPTDEVPRPARRPRNSVLSTEKIKSHFGIQLRPWQEALEAFLQEILVVGARP